MERDGEWYDADQMGLWEHQGDPFRVGELMRLLEDIDETLLVQVSVHDGSKPLEPTSPMRIDHGGSLRGPDRIIVTVPAIRM